MFIETGSIKSEKFIWTRVQQKCHSLGLFFIQYRNFCYLPVLDNFRLASHLSDWQLLDWFGGMEELPWWKSWYQPGTLAFFKHYLYQSNRNSYDHRLVSGWAIWCFNAAFSTFRIFSLVRIALRYKFIYIYLNNFISC